MRNIYILTKNYILCALGTMRGKNSRMKTSVGIVLILVLMAVFFAFQLFSQMLMAEGLAEFGLQNNVLSMGYIMAVFIALLFALQKVTGGQQSNDGELLLPMPFKKSEIMVSKALSRYLFSFVLVLLFALPSIIAYMVYTPFSSLTLFGNILMLLLIPMLAVGFSYIIDYITATCFPNSRFGNVSKALFTLVILFGAVGIYEYISINIESINLMAFVKFIIDFNPIFFLILSIVSILIFSFGIWLITLTITHEAKTNKTKVVKLTHKSTTPFGSLLKNEVNRYMNSTALMINTLIGPIGIIALTIYIVIDKGSILNTLCLLLGVSTDYSALLIGLVMGFLVIMTYPAAFSISLEGKNFWILKSMPIKANTILSAKALFNILLITPILILSSIIIAIALKMSFWLFLILLSIPVLMNIIVAFGGVFVNILFPKFEYESEATVIKQSLSSLIMMLGGMLVEIGIMVMIYFLLKTTLSTTLILILPIITIANFAMVMVILTYTLGKRIFNKLC